MTDLLIKINTLKQSVNSIKERELILENERLVLENEIKMIRQTLRDYMIFKKWTIINEGSFTLKLTKSYTLVIQDKSKIPSKFKYTVSKINIKSMKQLLKCGHQIDGVELKQALNLRIDQINN